MILEILVRQADGLVVSSHCWCSRVVLQMGSRLMVLIHRCEVAYREQGSVSGGKCSLPTMAPLQLYPCSTSLLMRDMDSFPIRMGHRLTGTIADLLSNVTQLGAFK